MTHKSAVLDAKLSNFYMLAVKNRLLLVIAYVHKSVRQP